MNLSDLTLDECIQIISGSRGLHAALPWTYRLADYPTRGIKRLGIPPLRFTDGPKGVNLGRSTCFPVPLARGASWDAELEERIGRAMAKEASAQGANALGSTCINIIRHPGWGRAQETYGADTVLLSAMGVALMKGIQSGNVMAVIKHFACNSIENSRFKVSVEIDKQTLHEIYLPHFKACAEAGAAGFMTAYNKINGKYCGHHHTLITKILREQWNFNGFVMSDFFLGIRGTAKALNAGVDLEMPQAFWFSKHRIKKAIRAGKLDESRVREAAVRVVAQLRRFSCHDHGRKKNSMETVGCTDHQQLSLESSRRSVVLLKNQDNSLPLAANISRIAVIGRFACEANLGSEGSVSVKPPVTTSLIQGLEKIMPDKKIYYCNGSNLQKAINLARICDATIITAGRKGSEEGEYFPWIGGGDRKKLELSEKHIKRIETIGLASKNSILILFGGSAFACGNWIKCVDSILMAWYPGMHGGQALAEIIAGKVNPSGRLPLTFPKQTEDCPHFDPRASKIRYDRYHDYRWMDKKGIEPAFPFGYGLTYTKFNYSNASIETLDPSRQKPFIRIKTRIENIGDRDGTEVVQLYLTRPESNNIQNSSRELKGFKRIEIAAGAFSEVYFDIDFRFMSFFDPKNNKWKIEPGVYKIGIGPNALEQPLELSVQIPG
jgi:beta-glucosidase